MTRFSAPKVALARSADSGTGWVAATSLSAAVTTVPTRVVTQPAQAGLILAVEKHRAARIVAVEPAVARRLVRLTPEVRAAPAASEGRTPHSVTARRHRVTTRGGNP